MNIKPLPAAIILSLLLTGTGFPALFETISNANAVNALSLEGDSILWAGTEGGIVRWDLRNNTYSKLTTENGMSSNKVKEIYVGRDGRVWCGYFLLGVGELDRGNWINFSAPNGLTLNRVRQIVQDESGVIWCGTYSDYGFSYNGATWIPLGAQDGMGQHVYGAALDAQGNAWFIHSSGASAYYGSAISFFLPDSLFPYPQINAVDADNEGNIWFAVSDAALTGAAIVRRNGTSLETYTDPLISSMRQWSLKIDSRGEFWLGTYQGLVHYDGERWETVANDLLDNKTTVYEMAETSDGTLYFGTINRSLIRYDRSQWSRMKIEGELPAVGLYGIYIDDNLNLWCTASSRYAKTLLKYDGSAWHEYEVDYSVLGYSTDLGVAICKAADGALWVSTLGAGVLRFYNGEWSRMDSLEGLPGNMVNALLADQAGNIWIGTSSGLARYDGSSITVFTSLDGTLAGLKVNALAMDSSGGIWCGTGVGVSRFDGAGWETISASGDTGSSATGEVNRLACDNYGNLWAATAGKGLGRYYRGSWTWYDRDNSGLPGNQVLLVAADIHGIIWISSQMSGLTRFDGADWKTYRYSDGLGDNLVSGLETDGAGNVWLVTLGGINRLPAEKVEVSPPQSCDTNGDGKLDIADIIGLLLFQRNNPGDPAGDYNRDGKIDFNDALSLLQDQRSGQCAPQGVLLAGLENFPASYSEEEISFIESLIPALGLSVQELEQLRLLLDGISTRTALPKAYALEANYPNPFNPSTTIGYTVPEGKEIQLKLQVFDIRGRLVRTLVDGTRKAGGYQVFWDGTDESGRSAASGVYLYRLVTDDCFCQVRKMVLLK